MAAAKKRPDDLARYDAKRDPQATPEPFGTGVARPGLFVVQQHRATRLHFDLRLELDGTLKSWAVPKGPSYDRDDKRLAIHVEDHPLEYADFEGIIPKGNYGAGAVIVWDRGQWVPLEDPRAGLAQGKLLFELRGYKLRGKWALVKIKREQKEWLLLKERDGWAGKDNQKLLAPESIFSGLTVDELAHGSTRLAEIVRDAAAAGAPRAAVPVQKVGLMLATPWEHPFSSPEWLFELKYDGFRVLAAREGKRPVLLLRGGGEATRTFPEIARALAALPCDDVVLDGELVVLDATGRASFGRLQQRAHREQPADIERGAVQLPVTAYFFDLLALGGLDLRPLPLTLRKDLLRRLLPANGPLRYLDHVEEQGEAFHAVVEERGLEGLVAKRRDSPYRAGRSEHWRKLRIDRTDDFVVVGLTEPQGTRSGFGALHIATFVEAGDAPGGSAERLPDRLVYAGSVGSGFSDADLTRLGDAVRADRCPRPACEGGTPKGRGHVWCEPRLVVEVRFKEWTADGVLRHPVFLRRRDDKTPRECVALDRPLPDLPAPQSASPPASPPPTPAAESTAVAAVPALPAVEPVPQQKLTNLDKVFWPEAGYTKGDLIAYYRAVAPWILPYLRSRPLVLTRFPDGIHGKSFFQKDAPEWAPAWVRRWRTWSDDTQRELDYILCDTEATLTYIANMGAIPLHVWASRVESLEHPDWCVLDLDPKEAPFADVITIARAVHELCERIGLPSFAKTSGASGMHVLLPLGAQCTFQQSRLLAELLARVVARQLPEIATITRMPKQRGGKVYVDYGQNGRGKLIAAPLCVRPRPGATVSTPLEWREVVPGLDPGWFTMKSVPERLRAQAQDPLAEVLTLRPDLERVLAALAPMLSEKPA